MQRRILAVLGLFILPAMPALAIDSQQARAFVGQDLHLGAGKVISYQLSTGRHALVFREGFSMVVGANRFTGDMAVVWLESVTSEGKGRIVVDVNAKACLMGNVLVKRGKGAGTVDLTEMVLEEGGPMVVRFTVAGEVFVTAQKREVRDPRGLELYEKALALSRRVGAGRAFVLQRQALVPEFPRAESEVEKDAADRPAITKTGKAEKQEFPDLKALEEKEAEYPQVAAQPRVKEPKFVYPVGISPAGEKPLEIESARLGQIDVATVTQRLYVWQKQDLEGGLLELQGDNAVIFYSRKGLKRDEPGETATQLAGPGGGAVAAVYICGDVVMTEGNRTIRAEEIYYDFEEKKAMVIEAVMRNFDIGRGIPIYVRAAKLRQLSENKFSGEDITLTSSEFYLPQISLAASSVVITDTTSVDAQLNRLSDDSYDVEMRDVSMRVGDKTFFRWPLMRSNLQRPDIPFKSAHVGNDNTWGTSLETQWYLSRLLGLREPAGTESTVNLDYYSKRGLGGGVNIDYKRDNYYGSLLGYVIDDNGEDRLGRATIRKDLEPPRELRGRFRFQHRHFLPYNWQFTTETSYWSDENFLEQYYRSEFNADKEQETLVHIKRIEDNWALSFLGKSRINDFADKLEELPTAEHHLTGESVFGDDFTLYSDTQVSRLRQRIGNTHRTAINDDHFSFASYRGELDMPVRSGAFKIVPFAAGTFGYDDRSGFTRGLVDGTMTDAFGEDKVWLGEAGVRVGTQFWKVYRDVRSRLWDLNQLRHVVRPSLTAVFYEETDHVVEQHDVLNVGMSQRLQTRRGPAERDKSDNNAFGNRGGQRTVDWMRLDTDFTWVSDSESAGTSGPDRFIWNRPIVPLRLFSAPQIFNGDLPPPLRRFEMFGPRRNYFGSDYIWRLSDTTALLSDMNFDMQSSVIQQFNFGFSRLVWPNISYYLGSRYLRRVEVLDEKGSNAFTFAATYILDPRYTVVFAQQFDFDYGANLRSDITLIRRYHRMYCGFTYSADGSLDRQAVVLSIWPQGVPELAIGPRRYMGLGTAEGY